MNFRSIVVVALTTAPCIAFPPPGKAAPAADASLSLDDVTVIATKMDNKLQELSQSASIVSHVEITDQAHTDVTEVLRQLPGIQFSVGGGPGQYIYPRLRGFSNSTLYVFDGITMNQGGSGTIGFLLGQIDPTMVQRVELLRGPHATLYGANTTSGVLSFTSLQGSHLETDLSAEGGSLGWKKARAGTQNAFSLGDGTLDYSLNASYVDSNGVNKYEFYRNGTIVGRTSYETQAFELGASFFGTVNRFENADLVESVAGTTPPGEGYFSAQIPDHSDVDMTKAGIVSLWGENKFSEALSQKLNIGVSYQDFYVTNNDTGNGGLIGTYVAPYNNFTDPLSFSIYNAGDVIPVYQFAYTYKTLSTDKEADYNLRYRTDLVSAVLGATYLGQSYSVDGTYSSEYADQNTKSIYGDATLNVIDDTLHGDVGVRHDRYTQWGGKTTYSIGASYDLDKAATFYANYGTSFTQPTLDQLYNPTYGNRDITPASANTIEAGVRGKQFDDRLSESLTYWHSYVSNVIVYDDTIYNPRVFGNLGEYANSAAERSHGIEFEAALKLTPYLSLTGNYTYTDAQLKNGDLWSFMMETARNTGNLGVEYRVDRFVVGTNFYMTDHRLRDEGDFYAPGYGRLDLYARFHATARFDLYARIKNATNKDIVEILGYRNPGIYAIGGASYRF